MIRPATKDDLPALERVAASTEMFLGEELSFFIATLSEHLSSPSVQSHTLLVTTGGEGEDAPVLGAAYFGPEAMAQGVMNLLFIGVLPEARNAGHGAALTSAFENAARDAGARLLIIETAGEAMFAPAWALYRACGYDEEARVRDYYDDGLDKLVFRKRVTA